MRLSFDADHVRRLLGLSLDAQKRSPVLDQVLDPDLWRKDLPAARRALLDQEVEESGLAFSARADDVDPDRIGPGLILVGDQGVYLMCNVPIEEVKAAGVAHVAYADQVNPELLDFEDWWGAKRESFGADDGTVFISEQMFRSALEKTPTGEKLLLEVNVNEIGVIAPEGGRDGPDL